MEPSDRGGCGFEVMVAVVVLTSTVVILSILRILYALAAGAFW